MHQDDYKRFCGCRHLIQSLAFELSRLLFQDYALRRAMTWDGKDLVCFRDDFSSDICDFAAEGEYLNPDGIGKKTSE